MKLVSLSHLPKNKRHDACMQCEKKRPQQPISLNFSGGGNDAFLPLDGANADLEPGMKTKKKDRKAVVSLAGPASPMQKRKEKCNQRPVPSLS